MSKIYFLTYSSNKDFNFSKKHLLNTAKESNFFEEIFSYSLKDLSADFVTRYKDILYMKRGGGYWIWKLDIVNQIFNSLNKNDLLVYMDAGSTLNYFAKVKFNDYCETLLSSDYGVLNFSNNFIEREWTTKHLFDYFDVSLSSKIAKSSQIEATNIIFKKNDHSKNFLREFERLLEFDPYLVTDKYNSFQNSEYFIENRHDQSVMSLLSKIHGSVLFDNETNFKNRESEQYKYPFLSTRHSRQDLLFKFIYYLNNKKSSKHPRFFLPNDLSIEKKLLKKYFYFNFPHL